MGTESRRRLGTVKPGEGDERIAMISQPPTKAQRSTKINVGLDLWF